MNEQVRRVRAGTAGSCCPYFILVSRLRPGILSARFDLAQPVIGIKVELNGNSRLYEPIAPFEHPRAGEKSVRAHVIAGPEPDFCQSGLRRRPLAALRNRIPDVSIQGLRSCAEELPLPL